MDPRVIQAVQSIAESLRNHFWPPESIGDFAQIALCLLTALTIWYLQKYTAETTALRIATRDQVEVNNQVLAETIELRKATRDQADASIELLKESQQLREQNIMPMLTLSIEFAEGSPLRY